MWNVVTYYQITLYRSYIGNKLNWLLWKSNCYTTRHKCLEAISGIDFQIVSRLTRNQMHSHNDLFELISHIRNKIFHETPLSLTTTTTTTLAMIDLWNSTQKRQCLEGLNTHMSICMLHPTALSDGIEMLGCWITAAKLIVSVSRPNTKEVCEILVWLCVYSTTLMLSLVVLISCVYNPSLSPNA